MIRLGACAAVLALLAPGELAAQEAGFTVAEGHFAPADLCRTAGRGCAVVGDRVRLTVDHANGVAAGIGLAKITYRPDPDCPAWELLTYMEFVGVANGPDTLTGSVESRTVVDLSRPFGGGCATERRDIPDAGVWRLELEGDGTARGELRFGSSPDTGMSVVLATRTVETPPEDVTGAGCSMEAPGACADGYVREFLGLD